MLSRRSASKQAFEGQRGSFTSYSLISNSGNRILNGDHEHCAASTRIADDIADSPPRVFTRQTERRLGVSRLFRSSDRMHTSTESKSGDRKSKRTYATSQDVLRAATMRVRHTQRGSRSPIQTFVLCFCLTNAFLSLLVAWMIWRQHVVFAIVTKLHRWDAPQKISALLWSSFYYSVGAAILYSDFLPPTTPTYLQVWIGYCCCVSMRLLSVVQGYLAYAFRCFDLASSKVALCAFMKGLLPRLGIPKPFSSVLTADYTHHEKNAGARNFDRDDDRSSHTRGNIFLGRLDRYIRAMRSNIQRLCRSFSKRSATASSLQASSSKRTANAHASHLRELRFGARSMKLPELHSSPTAKRVISRQY